MYITKSRRKSYAACGHGSIERETMQVKFCNTEDQDNLEISPICQEIREMRRAFTSCSTVFVGRDANQTAHVCLDMYITKSRRRSYATHGHASIDRGAMRGHGY
jgi:hypothetical protein